MGNSEVGSTDYLNRLWMAAVTAFLPCCWLRLLFGISVEREEHQNSLLASAFPPSEFSRMLACSDFCLREFIPAAAVAGYVCFWWGGVGDKAHLTCSYRQMAQGACLGVYN